MRALQLSLNVLLITVAAVGAFYYAIATVNVSGIHSTGWTDAQLIRERCHFRLVQPEWVSSQPDTLMNWIVAETRARLGVVAILWFGSLTIIIWNFVRHRKDTHAA
jgi:hypothetical protein